MMKWIAVLGSILVFTHITAGEIRTTSPDGRLIFSVELDDNCLVGQLSVGGKECISRMPLSITIDGTEYPGTGGISDSTQQRIDREIVPTVPAVRAVIKESCNERLIRFGGPVGLRIRVYNDGAAFRWESRMNEDEVIVNSEQFSLVFAEDYDMYYPIPNGQEYFSHQENGFRHEAISQTISNKTACVPALFELDDRLNLLLTDVNVEEYPGLWIKGAGGQEIKAEFPHYPLETKLQGDRNHRVVQYSDFLAKTSGTRNFPWRAFLVTDDAGLLTSTTLYTLADPCRIEDTSWIKPGKVAWDWYNAWNITDVPFKAGINQATYKNYIDFASDNKLQYVILDEGWSVKGAENLLQVVPELNIPELVKYAASKDIGIILWMTSSALEVNFEAAFKQFSVWNIKGLKVDFMQRDDQLMMDFCVRIAEEAADRKMLVDFHGGSKPTGLQRTYPNVISHESVLGLEQSKWSKLANPEMAVLLPFIRMAVGPMDYTPGAMDNSSDANFKIKFNDPGSLGTRCHQLAMYVVYLSPLQMLADTPTKYRNNPECLPFLQAVPTTWDETVVLEAELGKVLAVARRQGDRWFVGAMTDWNPRELACKLDFLGEGNFNLRYWADGPAATEDATDTTVGDSTVTRDSKLNIKLAPGGGYAAIIEPVTESFTPGEIWRDNNGVHINAHGGGILFDKGTYYWFGEHKIAGSAGNRAHVGVHVYSSTDLYNWTDEGIALSVSDDPDSDITKECVLERPKVIYNAATKKYVMWFHLELKGQGYDAARSGVAVADQPTGPYTFIRSLRPNAGFWPINITPEQKDAASIARTQAEKDNFSGGPTEKHGKFNILGSHFEGGQMARDMTLFVDDDGKAYHLYSSEHNSTLHIALLTEDYLQHSGKYVRVFENRWMEAPAICKRGGRYYLIASGCTGWAPNAARSAVADSIFGPWQELGNPCAGTGPKGGMDASKTFGGQSTYILPIHGREDAFVALFDQWRPKNAIDGRYVWLPIQFTEQGMKIEWYSEWKLIP